MNRKDSVKAEDQKKLALCKHSSTTEEVAALPVGEDFEEKIVEVKQASTMKQAGEKCKAVSPKAQEFPQTKRRCPRYRNMRRSPRSEDVPLPVGANTEALIAEVMTESTIVQAVQDWNIGKTQDKVFPLPVGENTEAKKADAMQESMSSTGEESGSVYSDALEEASSQKEIVDEKPAPPVKEEILMKMEDTFEKLSLQEDKEKETGPITKEEGLQLMAESLEVEDALEEASSQKEIVDEKPAPPVKEEVLMKMEDTFEILPLQEDEEKKTGPIMNEEGLQLMAEALEVEDQAKQPDYIYHSDFDEATVRELLEDAMLLD